MSSFLKEIVTWEKFELLIDTKIFPLNIVLKASYNFLDKWYFFFKYDENNNLILEFNKKENFEPQKIIIDFSDELLSVLLRDNLEKDNKEIREAIVSKAISSALDVNNYVELNPQTQESNQIDFDKDIDDILAEIENDPELKIDEDEISKILAEIEEESKVFQNQKPTINLDTNALKDVKQKFWNK